MNKRSFILTLILAVIVAAGVTAYMMWNKPHEKVEDRKAIELTADALNNAFEQNEQSANAAYLNKVIDVSGTIAEVSKNQDGKTVILLQTSDPVSGVQCTMRENNVKAAVGQQVKIKGFCNGYTMVVLLSDCIVSE